MGSSFDLDSEYTLQAQRPAHRHIELTSSLREGGLCAEGRWYPGTATASPGT
jgi:hypothetical protein